MHKRYTAVLALIALGAALAQAPAQAQAYRKPPPATQLKLHAARALTPSYIMKHMVTPAKRRAAAARAVARGLVPAADRQKGARPNALTPNAPPDYFGPYPNYANSPLPTVDPVTGHVTSGGIRKFVDSLPGLGSANANDLGQYIPVAIRYHHVSRVRLLRDRADQYTAEDAHGPAATELQGYVQLNNGTDANGNNTIVPPSRPYYLGPMIVAQRDRPVRVKFTNMLPTGSGGNLFLPVDTTIMGAGMGPKGGAELYTQNRAYPPPARRRHAWISDGTPHQWTTPAGENTSYPKGVSVQNVPDMPAIRAPGPLTFYLHQPAERPADVLSTTTPTASPASTSMPARPPATVRMLQTTRLSSTGLISRRGHPRRRDPAGHPGQDLRAATTTQLGRRGPDLGPVDAGAAIGQPLVPHVYMPNQNPSDIMRRERHGPLGLRPLVLAALHRPDARADAEPVLRPDHRAVGAADIPGTPNPSVVPEGFMDTPWSTARPIPYLNVEPKAYRFRILNACNDRISTCSSTTPSPTPRCGTRTAR